MSSTKAEKGTADIPQVWFYNDHDQDGQMLEGCWGLFHDQEVAKATAIFFDTVFDQVLVDHITEDLHCGGFSLRRVWTGDELEALEIEQLETVTEGGQTFDYLLTEAEQQWLDFVGDRYCISRHIRMHTCSQGILTSDSHLIGWCLRRDGIDRPPLSEDTQLARLIWFIGPLSED